MFNKSILVQCMLLGLAIFLSSFGFVQAETPESMSLLESRTFHHHGGGCGGCISNRHWKRTFGHSSCCRCCAPCRPRCDRNDPDSHCYVPPQPIHVPVPIPYPVPMPDCDPMNPASNCGKMQKGSTMPIMDKTAYKTPDLDGAVPLKSKVDEGSLATRTFHHHSHCPSCECGYE